MRTNLLLIFLAFTNSVFCQNIEDSENFIVTKADLEQKVYPKDSTANALILYEVGKSWVDRNDFELNTIVRRKLKILNRDGFNEGTIGVVLYDNGKGKKEKIEDIKATIYNIENDEITSTKLNEADIFEEAYDENYTIVKFTFPNLKEGSVIDYSYKTESPFMFKYKGWNFQGNIPKIYSEYNASIPGNWEYNIKLVGGKRLTTKSSKLKKHCLNTSNGSSANCAEYKYAMKDIPAFIEEDYMTTKNNYLARIEYELKTFRAFDGRIDHITASWEDTDKEIKRETDLGRELRKSAVVKNLLPDSIVSIKNTLEKSKAIFKFVQRNYNWNEEFKVLYNISIKDLTKENSGSIGEINALLHNLLLEEHIEAKPVLLSTRQNGFATQIYPVLSDFNYLLVQVKIDGTNYLLDATDKFLTFGQIPFRCLNQHGRLIDFDEESTWVDIKPEKSSKIQYISGMNLDDQLHLTGKVRSVSSGYHGLNAKKSYNDYKSSYLKTFEKENSDINFDNLEVVTTNVDDKNFSINFEISSEISAVGNKIFLNPYILKFFSKNPFKLQERSYPVDFGYEDTYIFTSTLTLDESYKILELPKPVNIGLPDNKATLTSQFKQSGNTIQIYFKLAFNESVYEPIFYDALKELMSTVVDVQTNALIVLERKP